MMRYGFSRSHEGSRRARRLSLKKKTRALRILRVFVMIVILALFAVPSPRAQQRSVFRSGTELVLVNVVVRDKRGAVIRNFSRDDFTVTEDDKLQTITSFDFEELAPSPAPTDRAASAAQAAPSPAPTDRAASAAQAAPSPAATDRAASATEAHSILSTPSRAGADDRSAKAL